MVTPFSAGIEFHCWIPLLGVRLAAKGTRVPTGKVRQEKVCRMEKKKKKGTRGCTLAMGGRGVRSSGAHYCQRQKNNLIRQV